MRAAWFAATLAVAGFALSALAQPSPPVIALFSTAREAAALPAGWTTLTFPGRKPSRYELVREDDRTVLRAEADQSASGLVFRLDSESRNARGLRWRWKAERLPSGADTARRGSDDAVARVYVFFRHPSDRLSALQRFRDRSVQWAFGETAPHATLLYVWDNVRPLGTRHASPYTERVRTIVVESGSARLNTWLDYERDVVADYRATFGDTPPPIVGVAVMTDADNTQSRAIASYGDIMLSR